MNPKLIAALELAGFAIHQTGGGCTAWRNESGPDGAYILLTDVDGCSHDITDDEVVCIGLYDAEDEPIFYVMGKLRDQVAKQGKLLRDFL